MRIGRRAAGFAKRRPPGNVRVLPLLALPSFCPPAAAAGPEHTRMVVVLYPNNSDGGPGAFKEPGFRDLCRWPIIGVTSPCHADGALTPQPARIGCARSTFLFPGRP
jgi:hypothetical protein